MYTKKMAEQNRQMLSRALELFKENGFDVSSNKVGTTEDGLHNAHVRSHRDRVVSQLANEFPDISASRRSNRATIALMTLLWEK